LIGQYGWDHDVLYVLEKDGKLNALIEWFEYDPLQQQSRDVFKFPGHGLYDGESAVFTRDASGQATEVKIGAVVFKRREEATGLQVHPAEPIAELRKKALAAKPPEENKTLRVPDLVEITTLDPTIKLDVRYATNKNFLGTPVYEQAKAFLQRPAAEALARARSAGAVDAYSAGSHPKPLHPNAVRVMTTPLVRSFGTGSRIEFASRLAVLSSTTNCPLRGLISNGDGRAIASTRSPKLPAQLITTPARIGAPVVVSVQSPSSSTPLVTSVPRKTVPPLAIPCIA